ncbi:MAG TPA: hydroxymethylbilane synthase [Solirubrobacteraceae bacterium]
MRIGTRRSALALAQAESVAALLADVGGDGAGGSSERPEIVPIVTSGDRGAGVDGVHDKSRWVSELESALLAGEIDLAVHSAKDLPARPAEGLELLGSPPRAAAEDVLCGSAGLSALAAGARVGTSSLRRLAQLRCARSDLELVGLRGNVDTRLAKLNDGEQRLDAIVLARAGLQRLGREDEAGGTLDAAAFVPAPGQGALALEGRAGDQAARAAVALITDLDTLAALLAERSVARELEADCDTPLGAHATPGADGALLLRAWVGLPDGSAYACDELEGSLADAEALGAEVAARLRSAGADELLAQARREAAGGR